MTKFHSDETFLIPDTDNMFISLGRGFINYIALFKKQLLVAFISFHLFHPIYFYYLLSHSFCLLWFQYAGGFYLVT